MFNNNFFVFYNYQLIFNGKKLKKDVSKNILLKIIGLKENRRL
jgi:hypothetical protein